MGFTANDAWDYVRAVVDKDILASKYLQLACKKLLNEYEVKQHEDNYPWTFHDDSANHFLQFSGLCKYPDGLVSGLPVVLHPWQLFVFTMAYGWKSKYDLSIPRFNDIYTRVARKNDKTTGITTIILYELLCGPAGHEQYITAVNRDQASIAFRKACYAAEKLPQEYSSILSKTYGQLKNVSNGSFIVARSRDNKASDGASCYRGYWDEAARIEDEESFDILHSSQGAWQGRHQNWYISTAQSNRETRYYMDMEVGRRSLEQPESVPDIHDRSLYVFYELDDEKEWDNPEMWFKANPSLGLSILLEDLQKECFETKQSPSKKSEFMRKKCNLYTASEDPWIDVDAWNVNKVQSLKREGTCYVGVDMGWSSDISGICVLWVDNQGQRYETDFFSFIPKKALDAAPKHVVNIYHRAIESGTLMICGDDVVDEDAVKRFILDICERNRVVEIAHDPYKSVKMMKELEDLGLPLVKHRQGRLDMGPPTAETEKAIVSGQIVHLGDPFISWQISNCQTQRVGDLPMLEKSSDYSKKIDNVTAMILAMSRAVVNGGIAPVRNYNIRMLGG